MNGTDIIDAVASRLGMKETTVDTVPSRIQILEWVNTAKADIVRRFGRAMPSLIRTDTNTGSGKLTDCVEVLAVIDTVEKLNAVFKEPAEYYSFEEENRVDKPFWTFAGAGGDDTDPDTGEVYVVISTSPATYKIHFVFMPDSWTDAASEPDCEVPEKYIPAVIDKASIYGFLHEGRDQVAVALLGAGGKE